jgi:hypothetical protein
MLLCKHVVILYINKLGSSYRSTQSIEIKARELPLVLLLRKP